MNKINSLKNKLFTKVAVLFTVSFGVNCSFVLSKRVQIIHSSCSHRQVDSSLFGGCILMLHGQLFWMRVQQK